MPSRKELLTELLRPLVNEWGSDEIAVALSHLSENREAEFNRTRNRNQRTTRDQLNSVELVERSQLPEGQKIVLRRLAERYDRREFLPNLSDIREFLFMHGAISKPLKSRVEAFRQLLPSLVKLPLERLEEIARSSIHSGPSQLGPLSDAIAGVGATLKRPNNYEAPADLQTGDPTSLVSSLETEKHTNMD